MIKLKKFIAFFLGILFTVNTLPISVFAAAMMSNDASEALSFIRSKGIVVGEVLHVSEHKGKIDFSVNYLPNNRITHIIYEEIDSDIAVTVDEGNVSDEILFKDNGEVYIDGIRDYTYSGTVVAPAVTLRTQYASSFYDTLPPGCTGNDFGSEVVTSNYIPLGQSITAYTAGTLAGKIAGIVCGSTLLGWLFTGCASALIDYALSNRISATNLSYTISTRTDNTDAPLQYYYEHYSSFTLFSKTVTKLYYEMENLL